MKKNNIFISRGKNRHLLCLLLLCVIFLLVFLKDVRCLSLLLMVVLYKSFTNISFKRLIFYFVISFVPTIMFFAIKNFNFLTFLCNLINTKMKFNIRDLMCNFLDSKYDQTTSNFIKLMILNVKIDDGYVLYNKMIDLSIVYMIVISGFHFLFIKKIINIIFKNHEKLQFISNFFILFFYSYLLNFTVSILRVFLSLIITKFTKSKNPFDVFSVSGLILLFTIPSLCFSLSFQLSYICTFGVIFISTLEMKNKVLEKILINVFAIIISLPFVLSINKEISLIAFINSFIFSYFFCFIFVYFFFFWFVTFLAPIHYVLTYIVFALIEGFNIINIKICLNISNLYLSCSYYILLFVIIMITYKKTNFQW